MSQLDHDTILAAAMKLPPDERLDIADALWSTLPKDYHDRAERACIEEAERRLGAVREGALGVVDGDDIMMRLRQGERP